MELVGHAQCLGEIGDGEGVGRGGHTSGEGGGVGEWVVSCSGGAIEGRGMGLDEVVRGTGCWLLQREGSVGVWVGGVVGW